MVVSVSQRGYSMIIVGTTSEVLTALVNYKYPKPVAMHYDNIEGVYHVIAINNV